MPDAIDTAITGDAAPAADAAAAAAAAAATDTGDASAAAAAADAATAAAAAAAADAPANPWHHGIGDDWREGIAGDDESKLNILKRFSDPSKMADSFFEGQETIRARQEAATTTVVPAADAPAEVWEAYRTANNVPLEAKGYGDTLSAGLELGEEDKAALQPFFDTMHANNITGEAAGQMVDTYYDLENQETERVQAQDSVDAAKATQMMKAEWGGDFEANKNLITGMFNAALPADAMEGFMSARLSDGSALFNNPGIMQAFVDMARTLNPAATLIGSGDNPLRSMEGRITELEGMMGEPGWHKKSDLHAEYQGLVDARDSMARQ